MVIHGKHRPNGRRFRAFAANRYHIPVVDIMSKLMRLCLLFVCVVLFATATFSQRFDVTIELVERADRTPTVRVFGDIGQGFTDAERKNLRFLDSYAGITSISNRKGRLELFSGSIVVPYRDSGNGYFVADEPIDEWRFDLISGSPLSSRSAGHVSWFGMDRGIVFLDDIIPQISRTSTAVVDFKLPSGWRVVTGEQLVDGNRFQVQDTARATFYITKAARDVLRLGSSTPNIAIEGDWRFSDDEVKTFASEIAGKLTGVFGETPPTRSTLVIAKFPTEQPFGSWEADARGRTIIILSADMPFEALSRQLLHEQLRHELFHQWIPNSIDLKGNYDWFYEGFALYQSLKIAVKVGRIRFSDKLETISNAERIAGFAAKGPIRDSQNAGEMYARGMLAAFYLDVLSLDGSGGKRSVETFLRAFYTSAKKSPGRDAERVIIDTMIANKELVPLIDGVILSTTELDTAAIYRRAGLAIDRRSGVVKVSILDRPNGSQRAMLRRLGYNN